MSKKKYISRRNQKNIEHHYWIIHIQISLSTNFQLKLTVAIFEPYLPPKGSYFQSKTDKIDNTIWFCIFESVFVSYFILNFWSKFTQERCLCLKTDKVNIIIEFHIFKLALVPNFRLNGQFWFIDQICPKMVFLV